MLPLLVQPKARGERVSVLLLAHVAVEVLLHGVLYALPGNQENGAPADVHAVVGDALQVVDHQGRTHPPLWRAASSLRRVGYQIHGLRVEEVHLVVLRLEVAGPIDVAVLEYVEALVEYVARRPGHLHEGSLQVLVTFAPFSVHDRVADVLGQGTRAHKVVRHRLHGVEQPEVAGHGGLAGLQDHAPPLDVHPPRLVAGVYPKLLACHTRVAALHGHDRVLQGSLDLVAEGGNVRDKPVELLLESLPLHSLNNLTHLQLTYSSDCFLALARLRRIHRTKITSNPVPKMRTASVSANSPALTRSAAKAARRAEAGMVKIHAHTIRRATPQRTALNRWVAPAPITAPDTTCVVLTGKPKAVASCITAAAAVWAANPSTGCIRTIRVPIVRMMRHPPAHVPRPIASAAAYATHVGTANSER